MTSSALVKDYMTRNVITVSPETPNDKVIELMKRTGHDGFPVKSNGEVIGIVTAFDLLLKEWVPEVRGIMSTDRPWNAHKRCIKGDVSYGNIKTSCCG